MSDSLAARQCEGTRYSHRIMLRASEGKGRGNTPSGPKVSSLAPSPRAPHPHSFLPSPNLPPTGARATGSGTRCAQAMRAGAARRTASLWPAVRASNFDFLRLPRGEEGGRRMGVVGGSVREGGEGKKLGALWFVPSPPFLTLAREPSHSEGRAFGRWCR
jgi:hypothetical protein